MRKYNFYAGPSTLPVPVLAELKDQIDEYQGMGLSLIETSHRSAEYDAVHVGAQALVKELLGLGDDHEVMLLGGGATLQFSMVPMNLKVDGKAAAYVNSGAWAKKAIADAKKVTDVQVVYDGSSAGFAGLPEAASVKAEGASYLHITSNETIGGVQWTDYPLDSGAPLVADMSSDIMCRPIPADKFGLIYAGAQKNLGPAGVTLVIIRKDLLERSSDQLTAYLDYRTHAEKGSLYNTPPVFSIWALSLVLKWVKENGGIQGIHKLNGEKAGAVYSAIDGSEGFYRCPVDPKFRSIMNIVFRLPSEELEAKFVAEAKELGMVGLKGHRSVGGCRASVYNSMPVEGAQALASFMAEFAKKNG